MTAQLIDGKKLAATIRGEIAVMVKELAAKSGRRPGLAAVLVGDDPASQVYVRNKRKACDEVGIASWLHQLPASTGQADLLDLIGRLNADPQVHGIMVQMPLPPQIDEETVVRAVVALKDVDGFGPESHPRP